MKTCINKYASYKGILVSIHTEDDGMYFVTLFQNTHTGIIPKGFLINMSLSDRSEFSGYIRVGDPDLFIDENGMMGEEYLLIFGRLAKWRCATYKGHVIKTRAHSDTHHFVTYHSDALQPRGVLPDWLPFATQIASQDFMGKILINDPELKIEETNQ